MKKYKVFFQSKHQRRGKPLQGATGFGPTIKEAIASCSAEWKTAWGGIPKHRKLYYWNFVYAWVEIPYPTIRRKR